jgi:TonB family protein
MFDAITEKPRPRRWQTAVIIGSAAIHAAVIAGVVVGAMWQVEKLDLASNVDITLRVPPLPGESSPPPAAAKLAVQKEATKPVKVKPDVPVQPTVVKDPEPQVATGGGGDPTATGTGGNGTGTDPFATGTGNCVGDDCVGEGDVKPECADGEDNDGDKLVDGADPACKAGEERESQDPAVKPPILPPGVAKGLRLSGNEQIYPPEMVRVEMLHQGKTTVQATVQLCVSARGSVDHVRLLKATGFRAYDEVLTREIREWRYRPYLVDGVPSPMCTVTVIIYRMKN